MNWNKSTDESIFSIMVPWEFKNPVPFSDLSTKTLYPNPKDLFQIHESYMGICTFRLYGVYTLCTQNRWWFYFDHRMFDPRMIIRFFITLWIWVIIQSKFLQISRVIIIRRKNTPILPLRWNSSVHWYTTRFEWNPIGFKYFLLIPFKEEQCGWRVRIFFFLERACFYAISYCTISLFCLWDYFPTRGNEKNYRMDC